MTTTTTRTDLDCTGAVTCPGPHIEGCWGATEETREYWRSMVAKAKPCQRCGGCGQLANDEDGTPWSAWANLPVQSAAAIVFGLVKPVPCPACS